MYRWFAYGVSVVFIALSIYPAFEGPEYDSFPLSSYPMFSRGRPSPEMTLTHALGVRADGRRVPLPPMISAANREVLQSMMTILHGVSSGPAGARRFCADVARRVAESDDEDLRDVREVELATSTFDAVAYFERAPEPLGREIHARCAVEGR